MCKIIPSPATLTSTTQSTQLAQDFDAWFETLNRELASGAKDGQAEYLLTPLPQPEPQQFTGKNEQFPFEMDVPLPDYPSPFSLGSPVAASVSDIRSVSPIPTLVAPSVISPTTKKQNITVEYISRPSKANNVKRSTPEDPITEEVARKRQKQNEAAKRCRQKRMSQLQECQQKVEQSEKEKFELAVRLAVLEKEKEAWILKEQEMNLRMERLRAQLDQSHHNLMRL